MADFSQAVEKTLTHEGGFAHVQATGEVVNFGITHWFLRSVGLSVNEGAGREATPGEIYLVKNLQRYHAVGLYHEYFWKPNRLSGLWEQRIAEKTFDLTVNTGQGAKMLQRAINRVMWPTGIAVDGKIGPITLDAANRCSLVTLLEYLREEAARYYRAVARNPVMADNLPGWLNRLYS